MGAHHLALEGQGTSVGPLAGYLVAQGAMLGLSTRRANSGGYSEDLRGVARASGVVHIQAVKWNCLMERESGCVAHLGREVQ